MKAFTIRPKFELFSPKAGKEESEEVISAIAEIVINSIRSWEDCYFWDDFSDDFRCKHGEVRPVISWVENDEQLYRLVRNSINPNNTDRFNIRSVFSCRVVSFGWDGQALLCMGVEDVEPIIRESGSVIVQRRDELITESDFFD